MHIILYVYMGNTFLINRYNYIYIYIYIHIQVYTHDYMHTYHTYWRGEGRSNHWLSTFSQVPMQSGESIVMVSKCCRVQLAEFIGAFGLFGQLGQREVPHQLRTSLPRSIGTFAWCVRKWLYPDICKGCYFLEVTTFCRRWFQSGRKQT